MTTAFSAIAAKFVTTLNNAPAVSENIFRQRERPFAAEHTDGVNVQFDGAIPERGAIFGAPVDWKTRISVECYKRSATTSGDLAVDDLVLAVYARLAQDVTLGGLVQDIGEPYIEADCDALGQKTGLVKLTYMVEHRTSNLSLE